MNEILETIILIALLLTLSLFSVYTGYENHEDIEHILSKLKTNNIKTPDVCVNLSLEDSAYCLRDYIEPFFKYNITDDSIDLTLDELKERGGDCRDWAKLYYSLANDLGFYVERPVIQTSEKFAHTFIVMSDETGYCVIDQLSVKCTEIDNEN